MIEPHSIVPMERIERSILLLRGEKAMLDSDLAILYDVETRILNQAVRRNIERFPADFMFQLTPEESEIVVRSRSQSVTLKRGTNIKYQPYAFTEQGVTYGVPCSQGSSGKPKTMPIKLQVQPGKIKVCMPWQLPTLSHPVS